MPAGPTPSKHAASRRDQRCGAFVRNDNMPLDKLNAVWAGLAASKEGRAVCVPLVEKTHLPKALHPIKKRLQSS